MWKKAVGAEFGLSKGAEENHVNLVWIFFFYILLTVHLNIFIS